MTKYKVKNNPLYIDSEIYPRDTIIEMEDDKAKAYGEDLEVVKDDKEKEKDDKKKDDKKKKK